MPKQLNVNLSFTADTKQAKIQLQDLQNQLTKITTNAGNSPLGLTEEISSAIVETTKLQAALSKATTSTGSLDLGAFKQELQSANLKAEDIANTLMSLGPEGQAAFAQLAQSVSLAEVPIKRTNGILSEFAVTLKNAARWQLSSSILHGFMGSLQSAYGYAQDLNESLNNIRIVTGQSTEQMADFAKQANESAKALSTTTTAYTDAALIFYQQGLEGIDVTERTDTVIKMANVTGESAEEVSSYMTAIWNNFDDGSESLEHYADVITALGATTASSSAEISEGLEKFASIGQTVGLSYDYATAALATVVANTRQSADVVGTAFKTIFSRLQGLSLGETLEDGVDLNKYSKALNAVGVQVLDTTGNMRNLDDILDDLAIKWTNLSNAQQTALAQTVAGTRQYSQLISLMNNWDDMQVNLDTAKNAEGSLQEQADIYAESWEAAQKRVRASMQEIYSQLLNDEFFIDLTNNIAVLVDTVGNVIDALGGLKGILPMIGTLLIHTFGNDISNGINNTIYNIKLMTKTGREEIYQMRSAFINNLKEMADESTVLGGAQKEVYTAQADVQENLLQKTIQLESAHRSLTDEEQRQLQLLLDINNNIGQQYLDLAKVREEEEAITNQLVAQARVKVQSANRKQGDSSKQYDSFNDDIEAAQILQKQFIIGTNLVKDLNKELLNVKNRATSLESVTSAVKNLKESFEKTGVAVNDFETELEAVANASSVPELENAIDKLDKKIQKLGADAQDDFDNIATNMEVAGVKANDAAVAVEGLQRNATKCAATEGQLATTQNNLNQNIIRTNEEINNLTGRIPTATDQFMAFGQTIMSVSMTISSIKGMIDTIVDPDLSGWEKFIAVLSAFGMLIPSIVMTTNSLTTALGSQAIVSGATTAALEAQTAATEGAIVAQEGLNVAMSASPIGPILIGLTVLVGAIVGITSAIDAVTMSAKEAEEQLESLNQEMKDFASSGSSLQGNIDELKEMSDEYDKLSAKAGEYDRNIDLLTESERERYNEIKKAIIQCNDASVAYYNDQGEAILQNQSMIRETIDLLQEQYELERSKIYTDDFNNKTNAHDIKYNQAQSELENAQSNYEASKGPVENQITESAQAFNIEGIQTILTNTATETDETNKAISELYDIINKGSEKIIEAQKNGDIDKYNAILQKALEDNGFKEQTDEVKKYLDNIVEEAQSQVDNINKAGAEVAKAEAKLDAASKIDTNWVLGVIQYNDENNNDYEALRNEGINDADAYLTAYVEGLKLGVNEINSYEDVYDSVKKFEEELLILFKGNKELHEEFVKAGEDFSELTFTSYQDYINKISEKIKEILINNPDLADLDEKTKEAIFGSLFGIKDLSFDENGLFTGEIETKYSNAISKFREQVIGKISDEGGFHAIEGLTDIGIEDFNNFIPYEQIENLDYIIDHIDEATLITQGWKVAFSEVLDELKLIKEYDDLTAQLDSANSAINLLTSDKKLTKKQIEELQGSLQDLEGEYEELAAIQDKSSQAYLNKLLEIREAIEQEQIAIKEQIENDKIDEAIEIDISTNGGEEKLQDKLFEICDADYEVLVEVKSDIQDDFDNVVNSLDSIQSIASKIGENFIVAAQDIEELNDVFPGILANMELVGDGTVKLNQEIVEGAMATAKAEAQADTDKTIEKLKNQADELIAKRDAAQSIADIAETLVKTEKISDEQKEKLDTALNQLKSDNSQKVAKQENQDQQDVADTAAQASTSMAQSFGKAYKQMAADAVEWAETAHNANLYATNQSNEKPTIGNISGANFETTAGNVIQNVSEKADLSNFEDYENVDDWQKVSDYYSNLAQSYDQAANNTLGKIGELLARSQGYVKTFDNVGSKKDKKGKEEKDAEKTNDEIDRYYDLNKAIEANEHELSKLQKLQKHYAGNALIESLKEENKLLAKQTELTKQLRLEKAKELQEKMGELTNVGATFASDGTLTNYAEFFSNLKGEYDAAVDAYNANKNDTSKAIMEAAKKKYEYYKDILSDYDKLVQEIQKLEQQEIEDFFNEVENQAKQYEVALEMKLDTKQAKKDLLDFINNAKNSKAIMSVEVDYKSDIKTEQKKQKISQKQFNNTKKELGRTERAVDDLRIYEDLINSGKATDEDKKAYDNLRKKTGFGSASEAAAHVKELSEDMQGYAEEVQKSFENAFDKYLDRIDKVREDYEKVQGIFEDINTELDHAKKISELLNGEEAYENMKAIYDTQVQSDLAQMESTRKNVNYTKIMYEKALKDYGDENNKVVQNWKKQYEDSLKDLHDQEVKYLEDVEEKRINSIKAATQEMKKALAGGGDLDWISESWEMSKKQSEGYLDNIQKVFELDNLKSKFNKLINDSGSVKTQTRLKKLMDEQIKDLNKKNHLSKYDVELAEKRLAVEEAKIALEEAQNNKTQMKLTRGADGNWSYQYVADENDLADKQDNWRKAEYDAWQYIDNQVNKSYEDWINVSEEYAAKTEEINLNVKSEEEREKKLAELKEKYEGPNGIITKAHELFIQARNDLNQESFTALTGLYQLDSTNFELMTTTEQNLITDWKSGVISSKEEVQRRGEIINKAEVDSWSQMCTEMIDAWATDNGSSVYSKVDAAIQLMSDANEQFTEDVKNGTEAAGEDFTDLSLKIEGVKSAIEKAKEETDKYIKNANKEIPKLEKIVEKMADKWDKVRDSAIGAAKEAQGYYEQILKLNSVKINPVSSYTPTGGGGYSDSSGGNTSSTGSKDKSNDVPLNKTITIRGNSQSTPGIGNNTQKTLTGTKAEMMNAKDTTSYSPNDNKFSVNAQNSSNFPYRISNGVDSIWLTPEARKEIYKQYGFDTGGYTGDWNGGEGRMALLHSKELVLNKTDTENILDAVSRVRDIYAAQKGVNQMMSERLQSMIAMRIAEMASSLDSLASNYKERTEQINNNNNTTTDNSNIDYIFNINADFPNANNVDEIKDAILSLPNLASQYMAIKAKTSSYYDKLK